MNNATISGLPVQSGDLLFTSCYWPPGVWLPGPIDHVLMYTGPGKRCIEAGPKGVIAFDFVTGWKGFRSRGIWDRVYGVGYPTDKQRIARYAVKFCERQVGKPYDWLFSKKTDTAYYCSELVFQAYQILGVRLGNVDNPIITPKNVWDAKGVKIKLK
ncbi:hypothetical protein LCGC14_3119410 [marine sediment metagenome]|uniref:NlpC/P60 domain-containing protein n=1 Tax=marine sediment metagenome TaxID=412755 RepID=A0A0F8YA89_9ZZZZ